MVTSKHELFSSFPDGQFGPVYPGQFEPDLGGQVKPDWGGQFHRILHMDVPVKTGFGTNCFFIT